MENLNLNLPPFYVGQGVVYTSGKHLPKGSVWTVHGMTKAKCKCQNWMVDIGRVYDGFYIEGECQSCKQCVPMNSNIEWFNSKSFAPIEERFISFADVIAKESPLIGIN